MEEKLRKSEEEKEITCIVFHLLLAVWSWIVAGRLAIETILSDLPSFLELRVFAAIYQQENINFI